MKTGLKAVVLVLLFLGGPVQSTEQKSPKINGEAAKRCVAVLAMSNNVDFPVSGFIVRQDWVIAPLNTQPPPLTHYHLGRGEQHAEPVWYDQTRRLVLLHVKGVGAELGLPLMEPPTTSGEPVICVWNDAGRLAAKTGVVTQTSEMFFFLDTTYAEKTSGASVYSLGAVPKFRGMLFGGDVSVSIPLPLKPPFQFQMPIPNNVRRGVVISATAITQFLEYSRPLQLKHDWDNEPIPLVPPRKAVTRRISLDMQK